MLLTMLVPTRDEYLQRTLGTQPMAVYRDMLADLETPLSAYWKLAHDQVYSFLLESVTGGEQVSRFSVLGILPKAVLRSKNGNVRRITPSGTEEFKLTEGEDPLHVLSRELHEKKPLYVPGLPAFATGAVGMMSYDIVRYFERLPDSTQDDLNVDDLAMMMVDTVVVFDHAKNLIRIVSMADGTEADYDRARADIEGIVAKLSGPLPPLPSSSGEPHPVECNITQEQFEGMVSRMIEYITQGDGIQMVPSQRFSTKVDAHPVTVYRSLRSINPSPYMFILRFGDFDLVGASPELLVSLHGTRARVRPIAGTRWRGRDEAEDAALADELINDVKERAEHIMLVDLGRNDLGRVCEYGTVHVNDLMVIEKYSHVMHIVSDVTGTLREGLDAFDLFRACHPAGTVSGAPKVRAMQIIDELETTRRGSYAGAVGFVSHAGDLDTCIALRTIYLQDGVAYVQAGGGVVYDSIPVKEYEESRNKSKASLRAIEVAQKGL
ncbi:MAG TPA: anthranilate synthase component I [Fimbriimonas sp.]|nr:anthranilate synthase component I [Fimbriimonas sp.]